MKSIIFKNQQITPSKIICIGRNYVDHIAELNNEIPDAMVVFNKPNSAISEQLIAFHQEPLHYEGEICFLFEQGRFTAVGFGLDLTKRALQSQLKAKGLPWERAKAFNGAALFSEFVALEERDINEQLSLSLSINGVEKQSGGVALMMYKPADILAELQTYTDLEDGDIVMTGTPKGVGMINSGDIFSGRILLSNNVLIEHTWTAK